jgi:hypothetical protein
MMRKVAVADRRNLAAGAATNDRAVGHRGEAGFAIYSRRYNLRT